ncbi:MAG: hypothetical protein KDK78_04400 [Chlamydiia bacterium]|nr:hypothetical protein [Chlamydiia bacterium]
MFSLFFGAHSHPVKGADADLPIYTFDFEDGGITVREQVADKVSRVVGRVSVFGAAQEKRPRQIPRSLSCDRIVSIPDSQRRGPVDAPLDQYEKNATWKEETITETLLHRRLYYKNCWNFGSIGAMEGKELLRLPQGPTLCSRQCMIDLRRWPMLRDEQHPHGRNQLWINGKRVNRPEYLPDRDPPTDEDYCAILGKLREACHDDLSLFSKVLHFFCQAPRNHLYDCMGLHLRQMRRLELFPGGPTTESFEFISEEAYPGASASHRLRWTRKGQMPFMEVRCDRKTCMVEADNETGLAQYTNVFEVNLETMVGYLETDIQLDLLAIARAKAQGMFELF